MSRRTARQAQLIRLRKQLEENEKLSPDIYAVLAWPETTWDACRIAGIYLDCADISLPFSLEDWQHSIRAPVELYFVFKRKKQLITFLRQVRKELSAVKLIF